MTIANGVPMHRRSCTGCGQPVYGRYCEIEGTEDFSFSLQRALCPYDCGRWGVPSLKGIVREITKPKRLEGEMGRTATNFTNIRTVIENSLCAYHPKHIDSAPKNKQGELDVELLVGILVAGRGTQLFESCRTSVFEVDSHRCIGAGVSLPPEVTQTVKTPFAVG